MNKSIIRHLLVAVSVVFGLIPATHIVVPAINFISSNLDEIWKSAGFLIGSAASIYASFKYGRNDNTPPPDFPGSIYK